jgi:hypothetical protein
MKGIINMTEQTQPTDAEIEHLYQKETGFSLKESPAALLDFARAVLAKWGTPAVAGPVLWPTTCDGKEQEAWETWAKSEHYDMAQHPLHYIFLNDQTFSARQGWRAGLLYAVEQMKAATPQPTQAQAGAVPLTPLSEKFIEMMRPFMVEPAAFEAGIRFAERAHGIKGADHA